MRPIDEFVQRLQEAGCDPRRSGAGWTFKCPVHGDKTPSAQVRQGDRQAIIGFCHACGEVLLQICDAIGFPRQKCFTKIDADTKRDGRRLRRRSKPAPLRSDDVDPTKLARLAGIAERYRLAVGDEAVDRLALMWGASPRRLDVWRESIVGFRVGWCPPERSGPERLRPSDWYPGELVGCWIFPLRDRAGQTTGLSLRWDRASVAGQPNKNNHGSVRGLFYHDRWNTWPDAERYVCCCEGASDAIALATLAVPCFGRNAATTNKCNGEIIALSAGRPVWIFGENDARPDKRDPRKTYWPGRQGAEGCAKKLREAGVADVSVKLPPDGCKDLREWVLRDEAARANDDE